MSVSDEWGVVLVVLFAETVPGVGFRCDSVLRVLRDGRIEGPAIPLSRASREAVA